MVNYEVAKVSVRSLDQEMKRKTRNEGWVLQQIANDIVSSDTDTQVAAATKIDTVNRAILAMSTNTYEDSRVGYEFSTEEIMSQ